MAPLLELAFQSADAALDERGNQTESGGGGGEAESGGGGGEAESGGGGGEAESGGEGDEFDPTRLVLDVRRLLKPILAG